ncbi:MAG: DUF1190 domain-containing protein [Janthinobacterium lividum]
MRRSATITLTLLAGAGLGLAYCHTEPDTDGVLESEAACVARLGDDAGSDCAEVFQAARRTHAATAPHFGSAEECRAATGADCTVLDTGIAASAPGTPWASTAASVFIPAMAGVMIGRALSDGTRGALPVYAGAPPPVCQPGMPALPGCLPQSSGSATGSGSSSNVGRGRYWYSGNSFAGSSQGGGSSGFNRVSTTSQGEGLLSRGARSGSISGRSGTSASRSGGLGFSASAHSGGGS